MVIMSGHVSGHWKWFPVLVVVMEFIMHIRWYKILTTLLSTYGIKLISNCNCSKLLAASVVLMSF